MHDKNLGRNLPKEGVELSISEGKTLTRVHLDLATDGISLSTVGAASATASRSGGKRQIVRLTPSRDGVTLSVVGAASAAAGSRG